jgi:hypothetical protein
VNTIYLIVATGLFIAYPVMSGDAPPFDAISFVEYTVLAAFLIGTTVTAFGRETRLLM